MCKDVIIGFLSLFFLISVNSNAATLFVEDFNGGTIGSNLQQMDTDGTGLIVENGSVRGQWGYRRYVATVDSDYNSGDWVFEIDVNAQHTGSGEGIAFIGFGSAGRNTSFYNVPTFDNSYLQLGEGGGGGAINFSSPAVGTQYNWGILGGNGLKHIRITKSGNNLTYEVDTDYAGVFSADWIKTIDITDAGYAYNSSNSRLFFGTYSNGTHFDNFYLSNTPKPDVTVPAVSFFEEDFNVSIGTNLENVGDNPMQLTAGEIAGSGSRRYISTKEDAYNATDWVSEITVNLNELSGAGIAYFGIGSAGINTSFYDVPTSDNTYVQLGESGGVNFSSPIIGGTEYNWGVMSSPGLVQVRMSKVGNNLTIEADIDYDGSFGSDISRVFDITGYYASAKIFFGTYSSATSFDDFYVGTVNKQDANLTDYLVSYLPLNGEVIGVNRDARLVSGSEKFIVDAPVVLGTSMSYELDGTSSLLAIDDSESTSVYTISAWVKLNDFTGDNSVIAKSDSDTVAANYTPAMVINNQQNVANIIWDTAVGAVRYNASPLGLNSLTGGQWHHIAATGQNNGSMTVYVDGQMDAWLDGIGIMQGSGLNRWVIGTTPLGDFVGKIAGVGIWNKQLSRAEVKMLASSSASQIGSGALNFSSDINADGSVNEEDLLIMAGDWLVEYAIGESGDPNSVFKKSDLNKSLRIDFEDFSIFANDWGRNILSEGLVSFLPLDGTLKDMTGGSAHVTAIDDSFFKANVPQEVYSSDVPATIGTAQSYTIDGHGGFAVDDPFSTEGFTVSLWFNISQANLDYPQIICAKTRADSALNTERSGARTASPLIGIMNNQDPSWSRKPFVMYWDEQAYMIRYIIGNEPITSGWHHIAVTQKQNGTMRLYVDGVRAAGGNGGMVYGPVDFGSANEIPTLGSNYMTKRWVFGQVTNQWVGWGSNFYYGFLGKLAGVGIWDRQLSDEQVSMVYAGFVPADYTLTVTGGSGGGSYADGAQVNIEAPATNGSQVFDHWNGDVADSLSRITSVIVDANKTVSAVYAAANSGVASYYVDPVNGNDVNSGTLGAPFKTLARAKNKVARDYASGASGNKTIYLRGGYYYLENSLSFTKADSAPDGSKIVYTNYNGEQAVIFGGVPVSGDWQLVSGNMYRTYIGIDADFNTLYINGQLATEARLPNTGYFTLKGSSDNRFNIQFAPEDITSYFDTDNASAVIWGGSADWNWNMSIMDVTSLDLTGGSLNVLNRYTGSDLSAVNTGCRYFLKGAKQFADVDGEWALSKTDGYLYLYSIVDPATLSVVIPQAKNVLNIAGSSTEPVKNIEFNGLEIVGGDYYGEFAINDEYYNYTNASAVYIENAENITVKYCHIHDAAYHGIEAAKYAQNINIYGNLIENVGFNGVYMHGYIADDGGFASAADAYVNKNNTVSNNRIRNCGKIVLHGLGVQIYQSGNNQIVNNEIYDMNGKGIAVTSLAAVYMRSYGTIGYPGYEDIVYGDELGVNSANWPNYALSKTNTIAYNNIYNCVNDSQDQGLIYAQTCGYNNVINNNLLHSSEAVVYGGHIVGIYLDDEASFFNVTSNIIYDLSSSYGAGNVWPIQLKGYNNNISNNIIADNDAQEHIFIGRQNSGQRHENITIAKNLLCNPSATYAYKLSPYANQFSVVNNNTYFFANNSNNMARDYNNNHLFDWIGWRAEGYDASGLKNIDPQFADRANRDYTVGNASVLATGFVNIDTTNVGVTDINVKN